MAYAIGNDINNADASMELASDYDRSMKPKSKKLSVLETHGYRIGRIIGAGSYATVKVNKII